MLSILSNPRGGCHGVTRRQLLQVGGAGLFGLNLQSLLQAESTPDKKPARARSILFVYLFGGPSQLETFDMKPDAQTVIRGPFRTTPGRNPEIRICEHLPMLADCSDQYCVIRTLNHAQNDHNASHYIQTGHPMPAAERGPSNVNAAANDWPAMGSVIEHLDQRSAGGQTRTIPSYIYLPNRHGEIQLGGQYDRLGQYGGWLGSQYNAFATRIHKRASGDNPYYRDCSDEELKFKFQGLEMGEGMTLDRLNHRQSLLSQLELERRRLGETLPVSGFRNLRQAALDMLVSTDLRTALDIRQEPGRLRDRYGRNLFGQSLLMGRRMIEAGGRFVTVVWDMAGGAASGWDSHEELTGSMKNHLLPGLDQGFSALLADMKDRGLLDETLVICVGEMGRTPQFINRGNPDGRDHWSYCFPALLAGAGVRSGLLYGQSDRDAAYPLEHPVSPEDLSATIFDAMGIDPHQPLLDKQGQPVPLAQGGHVLNRLFD